MKLAAQPRKPGHANRLRAKGLLPAVVYNREVNESITVVAKQFDKTFRALGLSGVIELEIEGGESYDVLVKQVQMDKRRREPQHVDFLALIAGESVDVSITVEYEGTPQAVREGAIMSQTYEVMINVLPRLIPEKFTIDTSDMEIGDSLHISDLMEQLPEGASFLDEPEITIATLSPPREEEPETTEDEVTEPEVIGEQSDKDAEDNEGGGAS